MSSLTFKSAVKNFGTHAPVTSNRPHASQVVNLGGKNVRTKAVQNSYVHQENRLHYIQPSTSVSSGALNGGQVDFRLENSGLPYVSKGMWLKLSVTNASGGAIGLTPLQIESVDFLTGANREIQSVSGREIFYNEMESEEEHDRYKSLTNVSNTWVVNGTQADSTSQDYYFRVDSFLQQTQICLAGLKEDILIRVKFQSSNTAYLSAGTLVGCTLDDALVILQVNELPSMDIERIEQDYMKGIFLRFLDSQVQVEDGTINSSTSNTKRLSSIDGLVSYVKWYSVSLPETYATLTAPEPLDSFEIRDASGRTIDVSHDGEFNRLVESSEHFPSQLFLNKNVYVKAHSDSPNADFGTGGVHGYRSYFDGDHQLYFTTASTWTSGNTRVYIEAKEYASLYIKNGKIEVRKM